MVRALLIAAGFLSIPGAARALSMADPTSYYENSPDGRFVYVMLVPWEFEQRSDPTTSWAAKSREIRAKWPKSGLYKNDGSREPLWAVEGYYRSMWLASDGDHAVFWNPAWNPDTPVFTFVAGGHILRTYRGEDLIGPRGRLKGSWHNWGSMKSEQLNDESLMFRVETEDRDVFWFDMRTGERITRVRQLPWWLVVLAAVGVVILASLGVRHVRRWRGRKTSK